MVHSIANAHGEKLDFAFSPGRECPRVADWIVVLGHGVTGNKDRAVLVEADVALNAAGFDTLRFSFSGNGESEGDFRDSTITKEVEDLGSVLDAVADKYANVCYLGHSMGGAVGVLRAAKDDRIKVLVSVAGMVETKTFAETEFGDVTPDEGNMWEDESCPLSSAFMKDLCETIVSTAPAAKTLKQPVLLVHGSKDDVVLPNDSDLVNGLLGDQAKLVVVAGAGHSFEEPAHMNEMTGAVVTWLRGLL